MKIAVKRFLARRRERGLALVSVLWALSILSLIAASMLSSSVLSYRMVRNDWAHARGESLAEAAINRTILALTDARAEKRCRIDGVPQDLVFGDTRVQVRVQDEFGKIDLNAADGAVLKALLESAGVPFEEAGKLVSRIEDWRTPYDEKEQESANATGDNVASTGYKARNAAFQSVDELKLVAGMTPQLFARIEPALTVYSKQSEIDRDTAPREVLLALPGMDARKVDEILAARLNPAGSLSIDNPGAHHGVLDIASPPNGRVFSISVEVQGVNRRVTQDVVIQLTGDPARPYLVLAWN
jgi:general secretion pathway protein K